MSIFSFLEIPTSRHIRALCIVDDRCLEKVSLVSIGILESVEVLVWIFDRIGKYRSHPEHRESLIGEPTSIFGGTLCVDPRDTIPEDMLSPLDLLLDRSTSHLFDDSL